jgi:hypothetical protein
MDAGPGETRRTSPFANHIYTCVEWVFDAADCADARWSGSIDKPANTNAAVKTRDEHGLIMVLAKVVSNDYGLFGAVAGYTDTCAKEQQVMAGAQFAIIHRGGSCRQRSRTVATAIRRRGRSAVSEDGAGRPHEPESPRQQDPAPEKVADTNATSNLRRANAAIMMPVSSDPNSKPSSPKSSPAASATPYPKRRYVSDEVIEQEHQRMLANAARNVKATLKRPTGKNPPSD